MSAKKLKKQVEEWIDSDVETAHLDLVNVNEKSRVLTFAFGNGPKFTLTWPKDYPKSKEAFLITTDDDELTSWQMSLNEYAQRQSSGTKSSLSLPDILTEAARLYLECCPDGNNDSDDDGSLDNHEDDLDDVNGEGSLEVQAKEKKKSETLSQQLDTSGFLDIGSKVATLRLIKDLQALHRGDSQALGFSAEPLVDSSTGLENIYRWKVLLFGFDKKSNLAKDLSKFQSQTGEEGITLEMRFSADYPQKPPFVRVVKPRFKFHTGHVTVGGSICMQLLTMSGWLPTNDIEGIIIQIRSEMVDGDARLDLSSKNFTYSESEAWQGFYRSANTHNWSTANLTEGLYNL